MSFKLILSWEDLELAPSKWPKSILYAAKVDNRYQVEVQGPGKQGNVALLRIFDHEGDNKLCTKGIIIYSSDFSSPGVIKESVIDEWKKECARIIEEWSKK